MDRSKGNLKTPYSFTDTQYFLDFFMKLFRQRPLGLINPHITKNMTRGAMGQKLLLLRQRRLWTAPKQLPPNWQNFGPQIVKLDSSLELVLVEWVEVLNLISMTKPFLILWIDGATILKLVHSYLYSFFLEIIHSRI